MIVNLVDIKEKDFSIVKEIYDYYILNSTATFHTSPVSEEELKTFIPSGHVKYRSFLVESEGAVCGYCYLSRYKPRAAYDRTAEIIVYLKPEYHGIGIGKEIMIRLEKIARQSNIHVLIGVITAENLSSIRLFEKCGYEKCAHYKQVGEKFNRLLDVVAYQKIIIK